MSEAFLLQLRAQFSHTRRELEVLQDTRSTLYRRQPRRIEDAAQATSRIRVLHFLQRIFPERRPNLPRECLLHRTAVRLLTRETQELRGVESRIKEPRRLLAAQAEALRTARVITRRVQQQLPGSPSTPPNRHRRFGTLLLLHQ